MQIHEELVDNSSCPDVGIVYPSFIMDQSIETGVRSICTR